MSPEGVARQWSNGLSRVWDLSFAVLASPEGFHHTSVTPTTKEALSSRATSSHVNKGLTHAGV